MPSAYWGVAETLNLVFPDRWQEWLLLGVYLVLFIFLFLRDRANLHQFTWRKWAGWLTLGILALVTSQLFPTPFRLPIFPLTPVDGSMYTVTLMAAVPSLLAAIVLGPAPALFVGLSAGLGRSLGQSHQLYDLFHYAFAAWIAAYLLRIKYRGRLYRALRMPVISGPLSQSAIALMAAFAVLMLSTDPQILSRLDLMLAELQRQIVPLFVEGFTGGLIVALILLAKPSWRTGRDLVAAPAQRSVRHYLLSNLLLFTAIVLFIVIAATFVLSTFITTRMVVAEMAASANATAASMTDFQAQLESKLVTFSADDDLLAESDVKRRALGRHFRSEKHYEQVLFIDDTQKIDGSYPSDASAIVLSEDEQNAVGEALHGGSTSLIFADGQVEDASISLVVPVMGTPEDEPAALIGRIEYSSLTDILDTLKTTDRQISGAVVDASGDTVARVGSGDDPWSSAGSPYSSPISITDDFGGSIYLNESGTEARQLIYVTPSDARKWRVAVSIPYQVVFSQALGIAAPVVLALIVVAGVFYTRLENYSRNLSGSISELVRTSRTIADGGLLPSQPGLLRQDELGELSRAFVEMQRGLKQRLDEFSLLLSVSREASTSIDLTESMPVILHGALRGTGAAGARALVLNPSGGQPLVYAEGPAAESMAALDRQLMAVLRNMETISLGSPDEIRSRLQYDAPTDFRIKALYATQLQTKGSFIGFLTIGFRQPRTLTENEHRLLGTLAGQAAGLAEKSYLFTHAEGGRRRLAAILASTSEAVIVTDPTSRIVIINRAMEKAFQIEARQVHGRAVSDVINSPALVKALSTVENGSNNLEIIGEDRRTYFANISTIITQEGQALGRVAVLHDVTHLKEIDRIKSDFVDNVSHDLRTPLTVLSGYASALSLLDDLTPEQRHYTDNIMRSVEQMIGLVENLLDLGRIEAGVDLKFEDVEIGGLLQDLADEHWMFAHDSGIRLHVRAADELPTIRCDRASLGRAISNLLMNGFKYAPNSGDMTLAADLTHEEMIISVRDRGPGIAKSDQMRLFEKFYRVERHGAETAKGYGLGLAMVKSIAERHGGRTWCESAVGKGSTFFISLPLEQMQ